MDQDEREAPQEQNWQWEVVENPTERLRLIDNTIEERIIQDLSYSVGFIELSTGGSPDAKQYADQAQQMVYLAALRLQTLQRVMRSSPKQPLPIDRTTYSSSRKAIIVLDQVPNPTTQQNTPDIK